MLRYWEAVRNLARLLGSDGCTGVPDLYRDCCNEHDIHYALHRTIGGLDLTQSEADDMLLDCMRSRSPIGLWSPWAWIVWLGVKAFGKKWWDSYEAPHRGISWSIASWMRDSPDDRDS